MISFLFLVINGSIIIIIQLHKFVHDNKCHNNKNMLVFQETELSNCDNPISVTIISESILVTIVRKMQSLHRMLLCYLVHRSRGLIQFSNILQAEFQ